MNFTGCLVGTLDNDRIHFLFDIEKEWYNDIPYVLCSLVTEAERERNGPEVRVNTTRESQGKVT